MKDNEWIELLESSPQLAYSKLIDVYGNLVYAIVINKLKNLLSREEIEDCVSDVFVEIFRNINKFQLSHGTLKSFIITIAKNTAIDTFRRISYRRSVTSYIDDNLEEFPNYDNNPDEETENKIFKRRLWEIVYSLGEPDSSIIIYQYFYDMKVREIANKLKMTSSAVQKRSIRAREHIRKILTKENYF